MENLVKRERFQSGYLGKLRDKEIETVFKIEMPSLTENGVIGDLTKVSKDHGKIFIVKMVGFLIDEIKEVVF